MEDFWLVQITRKQTLNGHCPALCVFKTLTQSFYTMFLINTKLESATFLHLFFFSNSVIAADLLGKLGPNIFRYVENVK